MSEVTTGLLLALAGSSIALTACGADGNDVGGPTAAAAGTPSDPRTVEIAMAAIKFDPPEIDVSEGETVRFIFSNEDPVRHEAVVGNEAIQEEHEDEMADMGDMGDMGSMNVDGEDEPPTVVVEPGTSGELVVTFDEAGATVIGCHESGHWDAGMRVDVTIAG